MKTAELIIEDLIVNDKDKSFASQTYEEDYAGGSRRYLREDLVISAIESAQKKKHMDSIEILRKAFNAGRSCK